MWEVAGWQKREAYDRLWVTKDTASRGPRNFNVKVAGMSDQVPERSDLVEQLEWLVERMASGNASMHDRERLIAIVDQLRPVVDLAWQVINQVDNEDETP